MFYLLYMYIWFILTLFNGGMVVVGDVFWPGSNTTTCNDRYLCMRSIYGA
jgi:hypothetical protein